MTASPESSGGRPGRGVSQQRTGRGPRVHPVPPSGGPEVFFGGGAATPVPRVPETGQTAPTSDTFADDDPVMKPIAEAEPVAAAAGGPEAGAEPFGFEATIFPGGFTPPAAAPPEQAPGSGRRPLDAWHATYSDAVTLQLVGHLP
jgi:hypothetical protein